MNMKILKCLIMLYVMLYCYSGILTKLAIESNLLGIKKVMPELVICMIIIFILFQKNKHNNLTKNKVEINILCFFYLLMAVIDLHISPSVMQFGYVFRDLVLPFILIIFLNSKDSLNSIDILQGLYKVFGCAVVLGFILGIIQLLMGWEWTSEFYTGYTFYGADSFSTIKISEINGILRVPSITGDSVIFGFMNIFAIYIFIINNQLQKEHSIINKGLLLLASVNIFISTSRTAMVMFIILFTTWMFNRYKYSSMHKKVLVFYLLAVPTTIIGFINFDTLLKYLTYDSLISRIFNAWSPIFEYLNTLNFLFGQNIYTIGTGLGFTSNNLSKLAFGNFDSMYLYIFTSFGIFGFIFFILLIRYFIKYSRNVYLKSLTFALIIGGILVNLFQGRSFIYLYIILFFVSNIDLFRNDMNILNKQTSVKK